jgi:hypothetical protein
MSLETILFGMILVCVIGVRFPDVMERIARM